MGELVTLGWRKGLVVKAKGSRDLCSVPGMNQGRVLESTFGRGASVSHRVSLN